MVKKCYIHIGMHKTGSSSIQETFCGNRFKSQKLKYFPALGPNHGVGFKKLFSNIKSQKELNEMDFDENLPFLKDNFYMNLVYKTAEELKNENILFSGEDFSNSKYIVNFVNHIFPKHEIEVISYIRNPIDIATSSFQQRVKGPGVYGIPKIIEFDQLIPDYKTKFEQYINNKLISKLHFKEFNRENLVGGDVIDDIAKIMNLETNEYSKKYINESINGITLTYLFVLKSSNIYKSATKVLDKRIVSVANRRFLQNFEFIDSPKIILCGEKLENALEEKRESLDWIERYLSIKFKDRVKKDDKSFFIEDESGIFELAKENLLILQNLKRKIKVNTKSIDELSNRLFINWFGTYTNIASKKVT